MESKEIFIFSIIVITSFICSMFLKDPVNNYAFIVGVVSLGFLIYFIYKGINSALLEYKDYDDLYSQSLFELTQRTGSDAIKEIYMTGEDVYPMRKIGNCIKSACFSEDVFEADYKKVIDESKKLVNSTKDLKDEDITAVIKTIKEAVTLKKLESENKIGSKEIFIFFYPVYNRFAIISLLQHIVPFIPLINMIASYIPIISSLCFPYPNGILVPRERCMFKNERVEIKGKCLIPYTSKASACLINVVEYAGKSNNTRDLESFLFEREMFKDIIQKLYNLAKNGMDYSAKLNPFIKDKQEASTIQTK